ncbi:hypothetical protein [Anaerostipes sp.]|uniref:hypothetical protein n=1 Tax=Anaerostipes sp. TaxID=1872530 RepID=UPI002E762656|nr:hypothetical protein [Anaerostipes sp.]MED9813945.1 hypothetical protein [Anaerostipes sp.]
MKNVVYKYLKNLDIAGLATYDDSPAIFNDQAPDDSDRGWEGNQYGRIIYGLNLKDDPERKVSGTMQIALAFLFTAGGYNNLLKAKKALKSAFEGVFLSDEETTISLVWRNTESFQEKLEGQDDVEVCGAVLSFDAYAFQKHTYKPLDPVNSLAKHLADNWNVTVINSTDLEEIWKPGPEDIAAYVRLDSLQPGTFPSTAACTWLMATMKVHVISESDNQSDQMIMELLQNLQEKERFRMNDGSPFFVNQLQYSTKLDVLRDGQVTVRGQYGKLTEIKDSQKMNGLNIN